MSQTVVAHHFTNDDPFQEQTTKLPNKTQAKPAPQQRPSSPMMKIQQQAAPAAPTPDPKPKTQNSSTTIPQPHQQATKQQKPQKPAPEEQTEQKPKKRQNAPADLVKKMRRKSAKTLEADEKRLLERLEAIRTAKTEKKAFIADREKTVVKK